MSPSTLQSEAFFGIRFLIYLLIPIVSIPALLAAAAAAGGQSSFKINLVADAGNRRLVTYFTQIVNPVKSSSSVGCASVCGQIDSCNVFSYEVTSETASCRFGGNPKATELNENSTLFIKDMKAHSDGFVYALDGKAYKRFDVSVASRAGAMNVCNNNGGLLLPRLYPDDGLSHLQMMNLLGPGDAAYLMWIRSGDFAARTFSANGFFLEAQNKSIDPNQHWQAGKPDATDNANGDAIIMTTSGWDDVPLTTSVNAVICTKGSGYEQYGENGKFYRLVRNTTFSSDAMRIAFCGEENGKLAIPYGANNSAILTNIYTKNNLTMPFFVDGRRDTLDFNIYHFHDGTVLDLRNRTLDARQINWQPNEPSRYPNEFCMFGGCNATHSGSMCDAGCTDAVFFLCERLYQ